MLNLETPPITGTEQEKKPDFYGSLLSKRMRPRAKTEEPEMKNEEDEKNRKDAGKALGKGYTIHEAIEKSTAYFKGDSLAADVWVNKYALKNIDGQLFELTPDDMHRRIAKEIARIEKNYPNPMNEEEIFELIRDFRYIIPQGSPMTGIGNDFQTGSLSDDQ